MKTCPTCHAPVWKREGLLATCVTCGYQEIAEFPMPAPGLTLQGTAQLLYDSKIGGGACVLRIDCPINVRDHINHADLADVLIAERLDVTLTAREGIRPCPATA